jgi:hypothetical protein
MQQGSIEEVRSVFDFWLPTADGSPLPSALPLVSVLPNMKVHPLNPGNLCVIGQQLPAEVNDVAFKAISLRGLRKLAARLNEPDARSALGGTDTYNIQAVKQWVVGVTKDPKQPGKGRRLVEMPEFVAPADVGPPDYFVSHAWTNCFAGLVRSIEDFLADAADDTRVWVDVFAVNQVSLPAR